MFTASQCTDFSIKRKTVRQLSLKRKEIAEIMKIKKLKKKYKKRDS
jgi:hypothetical protein